MKELINELYISLFKTRDLEKALEIGERIEKLAKDNNEILQRIKKEILKSLFRELKYYPTASILTIVNSIIFLIKEIGLNLESIGKIVKRFPQVLEYSININLRPKIKYYKSLGFNDKEIAEGVEKYTQIITCSLRNRIIPRTEYAKIKGMKIDSLSTIASLLFPSHEKFIERLERLGYKVSYTEYLTYKNSLVTL